jgi:hypothetical protein
MKVFCFVLAPDHVRASNNKVYYESQIKNETLKKQQRKGDLGTNDSKDMKLIPTIKKNKNYQINNERPNDYFDEREVYERLCRQNGTQVKSKEE